MAEPFRVRITVRGYELDTQGHLNQAVYHQYCEHARWEFLRSAGVPQDKLLASGVGPVALEATIKFHRELRGGDEVDVTCRFRPKSTKTFLMEHELRRTDGVLSAELTMVGGLLNLTERRLIPHPGKHLADLASAPELFGG